MKTAAEIIEMIRSEGADTDRDVIYVLEDGAALLALGITDDDQESVEEAHDLLVRG